MIHDKLQNLISYIPEYKQDILSNFIEIISDDMEEGTYEIDGDDIYAKIMSYPTKLKSDCTIEAHNDYVDVQFTLVGEEGISMWPRELMICISNDVENDFYTFDSNDIAPYVEVNNKAGYFTLLKTNEAHRPQESSDSMCSDVKKGVIKIRKELIEL